MELGDYFSIKKELIQKYLDEFLPDENEYPQQIHQAIRYSVFPGGKRIRALIVLASCHACGGNEKDALPAACGIELIHTYSIIHDDLPSMDNDDFRRGKLSCHKKFGEAVAILAGDALLIYGFDLLTKCGKSCKIKESVFKTVVDSCNSKGMIGGQAVDLLYKKERDLAVLEYVNMHKTGLFIAASAKVGAVIADASEDIINRIHRYGESIGLAFQIVDDVFDNTGYAKEFGPGESMSHARHLIEKAKETIEILGSDANLLNKIADYFVERKN